MLPWAPFRIVLRSSPSGGTPDVAGPYQCSYTDNGPLDTAIEGSIPSTHKGRYVVDRPAEDILSLPPTAPNLLTG